MSKRKLAIIILLIGLVLVTADSLVTNYMISKMLPEYLPTAELNPIMKSLAGTPWLIVVKDGWVILFLILVLVVKDRKLTLGRGLFKRRLKYKVTE
ncbi:MAG: hypothetical protein JW967_01205 [Dehalococcoidales bacterium]|nr:hypothetical protein [Dehalococcoidales bacterium]